MASQNYAKDEWLFREGEEATHCYILRSGKITLTQNNGQSNEPVAIIKPGECFGEIAVLENMAHYGCGAQASEPSDVEKITREEFGQLLTQCPPVLQPLFTSAFEQLKRVTLRAAVATVDQVRLDGINRVTVRATNDILANALPHTLEVALNRLPYKIGGYPESGEINSIDNNNLYLPCKGTPLAISRQHCQIDSVGDQLMVIDLGSRFNTVVNDMVIGRGRGLYKAPLGQGDNVIRLGQDSPYTITVHIE